MWHVKALAAIPYNRDPVAELARKRCDIFINISSSPFHRGHDDILGSHSSSARRWRKPFVFVNQVGGNDEVLFDGHSFAMDARGGLLAPGCRGLHTDRYKKNGEEIWRSSRTSGRFMTLSLWACATTREKAAFKR